MTRRLFAGFGISDRSSFSSYLAVALVGLLGYYRCFRLGSVPEERRFDRLMTDITGCRGPGNDLSPLGTAGDARGVARQPMTEAALYRAVPAIPSGWPSDNGIRTRHVPGTSQWAVRGQPSAPSAIGDEFDDRNEPGWSSSHTRRTLGIGEPVSAVDPIPIVPGHRHGRGLRTSRFPPPRSRRDGPQGSSTSPGSCQHPLWLQRRSGARQGPHTSLIDPLQASLRPNGVKEQNRGTSERSADPAFTSLETPR